MVKNPSMSVGIIVANEFHPPRSQPSMTTSPTTKSAPQRAGTWITVLLMAIVILSLFAGCVHAAKVDSVSWDESQHLYSGWLIWEHGDFGYNPEVPPLVKMWDAIPLL